MESSGHIFIVDEDEMYRALMQTILSRMSCRVTEAFNGIDAWEKIKGLSPDLIILDTKLSGINGLELTRRIKKDSLKKNIPILFVSAHDALEDRVRAFEEGADDFLSKPLESIILKARVNSLLKIKVYNDHMQNYQKELEVEVAKKTASLKQAFDELAAASEKLKLYSLDTILRLSQAAEYKDPETGEHIHRIGYYIKSIGRAIGLGSQEIETLQYASPMHDVGKIGIPDSILLKPGKLTSDEWVVMKQHTTIGGKILGGSDSSILKKAETIAMTHHEKWDGSGYPNNLSGKEIPLAGRITAIADVFDALTTRRPYKEAFSMEKAFGIIKSERGKSFDPELVDAFFLVKDEIITIRNQYDQ